MTLDEDRFGTLTRHGDGCVLRFSNLGVPAGWIGSLTGWHIFLDAIEPSRGGAPVSWTMEVEQDLMAIYETREPWLKALGSSDA